MERIPNAVYTKELREEAVKLVTEGGLSIPEVGRRLSIAPSTLRYWVKAGKEGTLKDVGKKLRPLTEIEMELAQVKRELAQVRMERDFLKNRPKGVPFSVIRETCSDILTTGGEAVCLLVLAAR
jgi:transposase-like protein